MNKPIRVLYHGNCPDGMAAAYSAYKYFGDNATYTPMVYTNKAPDLSFIEDGSAVFMVDFSLKRPELVALAKRVYSVTILDHHKSAESALAGIQAEAPNVFVIFDMNRSGAQIAWAYFNPWQPEPKVISHIADRDLWKFDIQNTREITEAIMSHEYDLSVYQSLIEEPLLYSKLLVQGEALLRLKENHVEELAREARTALFIVDGTEYAVPAVNAPYFLGSDLANHLLKLHPTAPFAATYRDAANGRRDWSLRSEDSRVDVSVIAVANGGGGHRNAAGMSEASAYERVSFEGRY